uniref:DUF295 domain-containing protein n=1 Tax=Hordeum vulgare subsp. vulgare TaxID=112509 RepID=A0A8I6XYH5_HORVV
MAASSPEWSSLLPDLLGQVIARLPHVADRARFRAVCRLWRSALRLQDSHRRGLPWVVLDDGAYLTPSDGRIHHLPLPMNTRCIGSTNDWIALDRVDGVTHKHTYTLHNYFSDAAVPLPELDSIIGNVPETFEIRKVLMRSTPDDLVAVTTNICKYSFILCRPGKGAWVAIPLAMPYFRIIDFAFLEDMIYAITKAENLYAIQLDEDDDGKPDVSFVKRITRHTPYPNNDRYNNDMWMGTTDYDALRQEDVPDELVGDDSDIDDDNDYSSVYDCTLSDCEEVVSSKGYDLLATYRHLVEFRGKLLMVRRQCLVSAFTPNHHTRKVEVFEADMDKGVWTPVTRGLGGGHAIFISDGFSNIVAARGEVKEDVIYFSDTNDMFDMQTGIIRSLGPISRLDACWRTCVFPPDLLV